MTKDTKEFSQYTESVACREYTLPRDERSSEPKGWIRGTLSVCLSPSCLLGVECKGLVGVTPTDTISLWEELPWQTQSPTQPNWLHQHSQNPYCTCEFRSVILPTCPSIHQTVCTEIKRRRDSSRSTRWAHQRPLTQAVQCANVLAFLETLKPTTFPRRSLSETSQLTYQRSVQWSTPKCALGGCPSSRQRSATWE